MNNLASADSFQPLALSAEPTSRNVEDQWLRLYEATPGSSAENASALQAAITEYAHALRDQGVRPERAVIAFKRALQRHGDHASLPSLYEETRQDHAPSGPSRYARAFSWFVDAYFDRAAPQR